jgi:hypothetical protein
VSATPESSAAAVAALLAAQGISLAAGRADKISAGLAPLLAAVRKEANLAAFETEPASYLAVVEAVKSHG